jgi:hypothetical protein
MAAPARTFAASPRPAVSDRLSSALRLEELVALGWDPVTEVFTPDPAHLLVGWRVCPVADCGGEGRQGDGLCSTCAVAWRAEVGVDFDAFCARGIDPARRRPPGLCRVCRTPGHQRPETQGGLCISCNQQRRVRHQSAESYVDGDDRYPPAVPRPSLGRCPARTCHRLAAHLNGLCDAHYQLWRASGFPPIDVFLRVGTPRHGDLTGRVVMTGLPDRVVTEVLFGIQACIADGRKMRPPALRAAVKHVRDAGVASLVELDPSALADPPRRFLTLTAARLRLLGMDADTEYDNDVWDLRVWGHCGRLSFVGGDAVHTGRGAPARPITQPWLKEATKAWAADALVTKHPATPRRMVGAVGLLSDHLRRRGDRGDDPGGIGRKDLESFLARLGRLQAGGQMSADRRIRVVRSIAELLRDCRAMGLCASGRAMDGLAEEFAVRRSDVPVAHDHDPDEVGLALPEMVMAQLLDDKSLALLEDMAGPAVRAAVELQAGVGRRTGELCSLAFDCLDFDEHVDEDGQRRRSAVLVHDMPKVAKLGCRLPIHQREAAVIAAQQSRVAAAFPHTSPEHLVLFPRPTKNPDGTHSIAPAHLQRAVKLWVEALPRLDTPSNHPGVAVPFPRERVFLYAFRHSFAQRHADAGTPVDTLKDLLGHQRIKTTLGYYRVTSRRKRAAQDALGALQLDAAARRVRPGLPALPTAEALRDQVGQVAVPFGVCTEPSNVAARGGSCPFRHRCLGCEYFRTDPSFQPELAAYLAQLLSDRERVAASPGLAEWARRDAGPAEEEIDAARRLVRANDEALASLDDADRAELEDAMATMRRERARLATTFPVQFRGLVRQGRPQLFPTIERTGRQQADSG